MRRLALLLAVPLLLLTGVPAHADDPIPSPPPSPFVTVSAPAQAVVGDTVTVAVSSLPTTSVTMDVDGGDGRRTIGQVSTDLAGSAVVVWSPIHAGTYTMYAVVSGTATQASTGIVATAADTAVSVTPTQVTVRSETPVTLTSALRLWSGLPWAGQVRFEHQPWKKGWADLAKSMPLTDGSTLATDRPWKRTRYRVLYPGDTDTTASASSVVQVATTPAGHPVRRMRGLPEPRRRNRRPDLPAPIGPGANPRVQRIPDRVFRQMRGLSWQPGCVARSNLRYVSVNYWGFDGYRYRGAIVVHSSIAAAVADIFRDFFHIRYPIRQMRLVDHYGRNRWKGANDYRSMAADNTSAFNCRYVVGQEPNALSPHASGHSIDINPWENPFRSARGVYPDTAYLDRSVRHPAIIRPYGPVRRIMARHGCSWLGYSDTQHFDCWSSWHRKQQALMLGDYPANIQHKASSKYGWGME